MCTSCNCSSEMTSTMRQIIYKIIRPPARRTMIRGNSNLVHAEFLQSFFLLLHKRQDVQSKEIIKRSDQKKYHLKIMKISRFQVFLAFFNLQRSSVGQKLIPINATVNEDLLRFYIFTRRYLQVFCSVAEFQKKKKNR